MSYQPDKELWSTAMSYGIVEGSCLLCDRRYESLGGASVALRRWLEFKKFQARDAEDVVFTEFESEVLAFINKHTPQCHKTKLFGHKFPMRTEYGSGGCLSEENLLPKMPESWDLLEEVSEIGDDQCWC